jgi:hypothetical protein
MLRRIAKLLGYDKPDWKSLLVESQKQVCDALTTLTSISSLNFLREDEASHYSSPLKFLHEASFLVGEKLLIDDEDKNYSILGICVGYGTVINNVSKDGEILSTIKKFYTLETKEEKEKIVMVTDTMQIKRI